jgi:diguanylate cyclase (GGDEF)-like protein
VSIAVCGYVAYLMLAIAAIRHQILHSLARLALSLSLSFVAFGTDAACLSSADPVIKRYEQQIGTDPEAVMKAVSQQIEILKSGDARQITTQITTQVTTQSAATLAELYALLAEAQTALENHSDAHAAASNGLKLMTDTRVPTYVNLVMYRADNTFDNAGTQRELADVESLRQQQIAGSPAEACLLSTLAHLQLQDGHPDKASILATRAYHMSRGPERQEQRVLAADTLSVIVRDMRDFEQALKLNQEVIAWDMQRGAIFDLATSRFVRGSILRDMRDHKGALVELEAAQKLSTQFHDVLGMAYNKLLMCMSHIELANIAVARDLCEAAHKTFVEEGASEPVTFALESLALIDVKQGKPALAMQRINRVLDQDGRNLAPRRMTRIYEIRGRTYAALGQYKEAFTDFDNHMQRYKAIIEADRTREAAALRVRYETDREIERSGSLQRELNVQNERLKARSAQLKWMMAAATAGICVVVLLAYLVLTYRKQKHLLVRLAQCDELTNLPNRRRTLEVARDAFDLARRLGSPMTIGLIDLDHFKQINDRFGHAVGDVVLQEFAGIGRNTIREGDVLGRWGGEEFLVVLPGATLDVALGVVDRVRQAALHIKVIGVAEELRVSVSAGLATNDGEFATVEQIIAQADAALYEAKKGGRDLVCVAQESYNVASTGIRRVLKSSGIALMTGKFERFNRA